MEILKSLLRVGISPMDVDAARQFATVVIPRSLNVLTNKKLFPLI
jgi:hypothetical protein